MSALPIPRCPHCGEEMPTINYFNWQANPWMVLAVYCPHDGCHKVLNMQVLPGEIMMQPEKSRLAS